MFGSRTHTVSQYESVATKTYQWRASEKNFFYYDKDKGERIALAKDAKLIPLTATNAVTGGQKVGTGTAARYCLISSNEFTDYKNEIVRVRLYDPIDKVNKVLYEGVYSPTIRDAIASNNDCKFTKNLYCLLDGEVVKLELRASSLAPWIAFEDSLRGKHIYLSDSHYVYLKDTETKKNGGITYYSPVFGLGDISQEENDEADKVAAEVEEKLAHNRAVFSGGGAAKIQPEEAPSTTTGTETELPLSDSLEELPF